MLTDAADAATEQVRDSQLRRVPLTTAHTGDYCVAVPGVDSATVEFNGTQDPEGNASAMTDERFGCGPDGKGFRVHTDRQARIAVDAAGGINNAFVSGIASEANDVSSTIVVP